VEAENPFGPDQEYVAFVTELTDNVRELPIQTGPLLDAVRELNAL
jgi:hypothetical protein